MKKTAIHIVCATDDNYVPYCGVMLTSLFENNKDCEINVFILVDHELSQKNRMKLAKLGTEYGVAISYCQVDRHLFDRYPIQGDGMDHLSIVTYYRLFAADLLPDKVDKALYLDCDVIVDGSLKPLFEMDWKDIAIGGAPDMCVGWQKFYDRLGYDRALGYFNAGAVLMNLSYWRQHSVGQRCMQYLSENYEKLLNNDQDVLNYVLREEKRTLPVTYNYQIQLRMPYFFHTFDKAMQQDILSTQHPIIIHYAAELKPWMVKYYSYPFNDEWHRYKKMSPWRGMRDLLPAQRAWASFIKRYFLWPLGIKLKKPELV